MFFLLLCVYLDSFDSELCHQEHRSRAVVYSDGVYSVSPVHKIKECHKLPCKPYLSFQKQISTVLGSAFDRVGPSLVPFIIGIRKPEFMM